MKGTIAFIVSQNRLTFAAPCSGAVIEDVKGNFSISGTIFHPVNKRFTSALLRPADNYTCSPGLFARAFVCRDNDAMIGDVNETEVRMLLSRNLKRLRADRNLSQLSLAVKAGLAHNFINDIENGKKWISPRTLAALASALGTDPQEFFLPETALPEQDGASLEGHLDNLAGDVLLWVDDVRGRYL
jgi:transcriptional regulator with XRE-family HTH domain